MDFTIFKEKIRNGLQEFLGEEVGVETNRITKNNGVILEALCISEKGVNVSPTIYLEDFFGAYQKGTAISEIVYQIARTYDEAKIEKNINMNFFLDYEQVRGKLIYRLINFEKNKELLEKIPHVRFLDLAVTFQCMLMNDRIGNATVQITDKHCDMWKVGEKELLQEAKINTPKYLRHRITSMDEVIQNIFAENLRKEFDSSAERNTEEKADLEITEEWIEKVSAQMAKKMRQERRAAPMYVLTNGFKINGASCILYPKVMRRFAEELESGFYILPSSVHEVILVPEDGIKAEQLREMVKDVNETQVEEEEILSDNVYYYDKKLDEIVIAE